MCLRNDDQWPGDSKNGPSESEQPTYDGPPGMDPDGIIESNWDLVSNQLLCLGCNVILIKKFMLIFYV